MSAAYLLKVSERLTPWTSRAFDPYPWLSSTINRVLVGYIWGAEEFAQVQSYDAPPLTSPWSCRVLTRGGQIFGVPTQVTMVNVTDSVRADVFATLSRRAAGPA